MVLNTCVDTNYSTSQRMRILDIVRGTTVDGPGFRTSIYFAGCNHACPGCHNPESWDLNKGIEMTCYDIMRIIEEEDFDVTLSGGDPLYQPKEVSELCRLIKAAGYTVWIYTGFRWEEIISDTLLLNAVKNAETVVDSPFLRDLRDTDLLFRGSSNQRLIDVAASLEKDEIVLWKRK